MVTMGTTLRLLKFFIIIIITQQETEKEGGKPKPTNYPEVRKLYDLRMAHSTYSRGISSRMEAILKNQFLHVSLADSGTSAGVKLAIKEKLALQMSTNPNKVIKNKLILNALNLSIYFVEGSKQ